MRFLDNLEPFRGNGGRNAKGQTLEEFLEDYDAKRYDCPSNTVDMLIFCSKEAYRRFGQPLKLLMVRRSNHPSIGAWALPGGFVNIREDIEDAAKRELQEETGVAGLPLVQVRTWGEYDRDPRWRVITTSWLALAEGDLPVQAGDDAADAKWFDVEFSRVAAEEEADTLRERWALKLTAEGSASPALAAEVERTLIRRGILTETHYRLLSSHGIANDHASLIADALLYLKERAERA